MKSELINLDCLEGLSKGKVLKHANQKENINSFDKTSWVHVPHEKKNIHVIWERFKSKRK